MLSRRNLAVLSLLAAFLCLPCAAQQERWQQLNSQVGQLYSQGRYAEAIPLAQEAVRVAEEILGAEHVHTATSLNNLAALYCDQGRYAEAEPLLQRALRIYEKALGPEHPQVAITLSNLAELYDAQGRHEEADTLRERALNIRGKKGSVPEGPDVAISLKNLARLSDAESASRIVAKAFAPGPTAGPSWNATLFNSLAAMYVAGGNYREAIPLAEKVVLEAEAAFGPEHLNTATSLYNLASLQFAQGNAEAAQPLYARDLDILFRRFQYSFTYMGEKERLQLLETVSGNFPAYFSFCTTYAPQMPALAGSMYDVLLWEKGFVGQSIAALRARIAASGDPEALKLLDRLTALKQQLSAQLNSPGPDHAAWQKQVSDLQAQADQVEQELVRRSATLQEDKKLERVTWRDVQKELKPGEAAVEMVKFHFYDGKKWTDSYKYVALVVRPESKLPELVVLDDGSGGSEQGAEGKQPQGPSTAVASATSARDDKQRQTQGPSPAARDQDDKQSQTQGPSPAARARDDKQSQTQGPSPAARARDDKQRQTQGPSPAARAQDDKQSQTQGPSPRQVGAQDDSAKEKTRAERALKDYRQLIGESVPAGAGREFYQTFWQPLEKALGDAKTVYLSPDGELNQVALGLVPDASGKLLMEQYDLRLVSSTKDLLRQARAAGSQSAVLVGNPKFEMEDGEQHAAVRGVAPAQPVLVASAAVGGPGLRSRDPLRGALTPLPGTKVEVESVAKLLQASGWHTDTYTESRALEEAVKQVRQPRVLHLATHGFFLPDQQVKHQAEMLGVEKTPTMDDPMLRSGLFLAGAERTVVENKPPADLEDGVLTAYEATQLNLQGTELVVLSACETGLGKVEAGEGVFGLRRALEIAGAQSVMMTMWSVPDRETQELMTLFYSKWLAGKDKHQALREAQQEMREKVKARYGRDLPFYWGAFVLVGR
jgi:CHAT domain-containing protein